MDQTQIAILGAWVQVGVTSATLVGFAAFIHWQLRSARKNLKIQGEISKQNLEKELAAQRSEATKSRIAETITTLQFRRIDLLAELSATIADLMSTQSQLVEQSQRMQHYLAQGASDMAKLEGERCVEPAARLVNLRSAARTLAERYGVLPTIQGSGSVTHLGDVMYDWFRGLDTARSVGASGPELFRVGGLLILELRQLQSIEEDILHASSANADSSSPRQLSVRTGGLRLKDPASF